MSQDLLNTYVIGFDRSIRETVEVNGGKLRPYIMLATGDLYRKEGVYQRTTGGGLPQVVTNRFGDSPISELDYSRRRTSRIAYQDGQFMDWADLSKMGVDPRNAKLTAMKNKFLRQEDIIIDQAMLGSANTTDLETSATSVTLTNAVSSIHDGTAEVLEGFTYSKFLQALAQFGNNNVDVENLAPVFKISWTQWQEMMADDNFINFDYTASRPIDSNSYGKIYDYMGAKFCISNIIPYFSQNTCSVGDGSTVGSLKIANSDVDNAKGTWTRVKNIAGTTPTGSNYSYRAVYAFAPSASLFEVNPDMTTKVSERADKGFNYYAYMKAEFGAVRMEEEKVVVIPCRETN